MKASVNAEDKTIASWRCGGAEGWSGPSSICIARLIWRFFKGCREQDTTLDNRMIPSRIFPTNRTDFEIQACLPSPRTPNSAFKSGGGWVADRLSQVLGHVAELSLP